MSTTIEDRLNDVWAPRPGFVGSLMAVNHKIIGRRYIVTAFTFFVLALSLIHI